MVRKRLHLYIGIAYMYEEEKSDAFNLELYNHRASSYLTTILDFGRDKPKIYNTLYYQPLLKDIGNYRLSEQFTVEFPITGNLGFNANFNYFLNSRTPAGDSEYSTNVSFGFVYNFQSEIPKNETKIDSKSIEKNRPDN